MEWIKTIIYGIVEGITEWLPISSTGHMILLEKIMPMKVSSDFWEMYLVVIQLGAILAVVLMFWNQLWPFCSKEKGYIKKDTFSMWFKIIVACVPAAVVELVWGDQLEAAFYHYQVVALMLILVGIVFLIVERWNKGRDDNHRTDYVSCRIYDRYVSVDRGIIPGNIQIRCNDHRWFSDRTFPYRSGGVHILLGDSGHVWC